MPVKTDLGVRVQGFTHCRYPGLDVVGQHVARGVGEVNTVGAVALHQLALLDQPFRAVHVRHHQKAHGVHTQLAGIGNMLLGDVRLGAMGGDPNRVDPQFEGHLQVVHGPDTRQQQG